jgi:hypothetical protein
MALLCSREDACCTTGGWLDLEDASLEFVEKGLMTLCESRKP